MTSLFEFQLEVESFMEKHMIDKKTSLWDKLVQSAVKSSGISCNGLLLNKADDYTREFLSKMRDEEIRPIWKESENGMMSIEGGFDEVHRLQMIEDIALDIYEAIAENACHEATENYGHQYSG